MSEYNTKEELWKINVNDLMEVYFKHFPHELLPEHDWEVINLTNFNSTEEWKHGGEAEVLVSISKVD
tara:strand:- start:968 stop:1168 length:201 start_codon:yes stop_codon:yes gene_type:complete